MAGTGLVGRGGGEGDAGSAEGVGGGRASMVAEAAEDAVAPGADRDAENASEIEATVDW